MWDTVAKIFPADREFVPTDQHKEEALSLFIHQFADGETHEAKTFEHLEFIDQGENMESVTCPACHVRTVLNFFNGDDPGIIWWYQVTELLAEKPVDQVQTTLPCCRTAVPFTSLEFDWPAGFARFQLSVWNPTSEGDVPAEKLEKLSQVVGAPLKAIWAHY